MDLSDYDKIIQKHITARKSLIHIEEMNRNFENENKDREFENIEKYKPITESNR